MLLFRGRCGGYADGGCRRKAGGVVSPPRAGLKGAGVRSDFFLASMQGLFRQSPAWPLHKNIPQRSHCFLVRTPQQTLLGL